MKFKDRLMKWNFKRIAIVFLVVAIVYSIAASGLFMFQAKDMITNWMENRPSITAEDPENPNNTPRMPFGRDQEENFRGNMPGFRIYGRMPGFGIFGGMHGFSGIAGYGISTNVNHVWFAVLALTGLLLYTVYRVLLSLWIAQKAMKAGLNPKFWGLITLFFELFAVLAFFLYRSTKSRCPTCGQIQTPDSAFCSSCGAALSVNCPDCGTKLNPKDQFCSKCGRRMH